MDARQALARAIAHFESIDHRFAWSVAEGNLADLAARTGSLAEAFSQGCECSIAGARATQKHPSLNLCVDQRLLSGYAHCIADAAAA